MLPGHFLAPPCQKRGFLATGKAAGGAMRAAFECARSSHRPVWREI